MKKSKTHTHFPDESILAPIRDKLSDPNYKGGNFSLPPDASQVDLAKYQICQMIARYQREHSLLQRDIARELSVDESRVSDILRGKIEGFTLDRLLEYASKIYPKLKVTISAA